MCLLYKNKLLTVKLHFIMSKSVIDKFVYYFICNCPLLWSVEGFFNMHIHIYLSVPYNGRII